MSKQLKPCLMYDYGCRTKRLTHLFCPNHWVQIHLDDREVLDNPQHQRVATWGVDAATGQLAYCPDPEKFRDFALKIVEALAAKEFSGVEVTKELDGQPAAGVEVICPSCGVVNIKSARANSCGACGNSLIQPETVPVTSDEE